MLPDWACDRCGNAFIGYPPDCGLCITCQEETGLTPGLILPAAGGVTHDH